VYILDLTNFDNCSSSSLFISLCKPADYFENYSENSEFFYKSHIFVGRLLEKDIEFLDDCYSNYYSSDLELKNLKKGKYIIFCHLDLDELKEKIQSTSAGKNSDLNLNSQKVFLNKKIGILKIYSNQEFLILERLTTNYLDFHLAFDYLIHSLYQNKFSKNEKNKKYLLTNEKSIYYSNFRINKYSKFIVYIFKNDKLNTQFLLEFQISMNLTKQKINL
jgi:hypothetical protein